MVTQQAIERPSLRRRGDWLASRGRLEFALRLLKSIERQGSTRKLLSKRRFRGALFQSSGSVA